MQAVGVEDVEIPRVESQIVGPPLADGFLAACGALKPVDVHTHSMRETGEFAVGYDILDVLWQAAMVACMSDRRKSVGVGRRRGAWTSTR